MTTGMSEPVRVERPASAHQAPVARRWQLLLTSSILGVLVLYVGRATIDYNIVELPAERHIGPVVSELAPQGWSFFTKSPREPDIRFVAREGDGAGDPGVKVLTPHSRAENLFGWNRASRAQVAELALVVGELEDSDWMSCESGQCGAMERPVPVDNKEPVPSLCGLLTLQYVEPVAWAYRDFVDSTYQVTNQIEVDIQC